MRYPGVLFRILILFFYVASARASSELPEWVFGKAVLDHYEAVGPGRSRRPEKTLQSGLTVFGGVTPKFSEELNGKLLLRGSAFRRSLEKNDAFILRGDVREAWIEHGRGGLSLKIGEIITPWGRSDAVNPTDFLTAKDYTFLSTADEVRRKGAPGFRMNFTPNDGVSPWEFTLAWNARYPQSKLLIPASSVPAGLAVETDPKNPRLLGDRQEWAIKMAYLAPSFDFSLSAFDGRTHFGQFVWNGSKVSLEYLPVRSLGGDFSVTLNDFVIRAETAYFFYNVGRAGLGDLALTEPNHWDSVVGVEHPFGARFRLLAQMLYRVHPTLRDSQSYLGGSPADTAIVRAVGRANALIQNYQDHSRVGATLLLSYQSEDQDWNAEIAAIGNFVGGDYILRPKPTRKLTDSIRASLGMEYYGGPTDRPLGALRDYRSAYLEGVMTF